VKSTQAGIGKIKVKEERSSVNIHDPKWIPILNNYLPRDWLPVLTAAERRAVIRNGAAMRRR
jgi:hypothetical protein